MSKSIKKSLFLIGVFGILVMAFNNCSQGGFATISSSEQLASTTEGVPGSDPNNPGSSPKPGIPDPGKPIEVPKPSNMQGQFLTWDAGSGPSNTYWSGKLQLLWKNKGSGDWMDAQQVSQGTSPYATAEVKQTGPVTINVTALVSRWVSNKQNRGFFLKSNQDFPFYFTGRTSPETSLRPQLSVTTSSGKFNAPIFSNAQFTSTSTGGIDSRAQFQVSKGLTTSIVQFDLTQISGTVISADLTLNCAQLKYPGILNIFEADPPTFLIGGGGLSPLKGLAENYPGDVNITNHPSVIFASDFSDTSRKVFAGDPSGATTIFDPILKTNYLRGAILQGKLGGGALEADVVKSDESGLPKSTEKELYARYYVFLEDDWGSHIDANKMPGWDNRFGWWNSVGYWQGVTGNGGAKGSGRKIWNSSMNRWEYHGSSMRGHGGTLAGDGNPYDNLFWIGGYIYNLDQPSPYGDGIKWHGFVIGKGKWYSIEHYVKMNSVVGPFDSLGNGEAAYDGVYKVWVDGILAYERKNFRWTRHPDFGLQGFWLNWYHGGTVPSPKDMHYRMRSLVISRQYIGPRNE